MRQPRRSRCGGVRTAYQFGLSVALVSRPRMPADYLVKPLRRNELLNLWTRVPSLRWAALGNFFAEVSHGVPPRYFGDLSRRTERRAALLNGMQPSV